MLVLNLLDYVLRNNILNCQYPNYFQYYDIYLVYSNIEFDHPDIKKIFDFQKFKLNVWVENTLAYAKDI